MKWLAAVLLAAAVQAQDYGYVQPQPVAGPPGNAIVPVSGPPNNAIVEPTPSPAAYQAPAYQAPASVPVVPIPPAVTTPAIVSPVPEIKYSSPVESSKPEESKPAESKHTTAEHHSFRPVPYGSNGTYTHPHYNATRNSTHTSFSTKYSSTKYSSTKYSSTKLHITDTPTPTLAIYGAPTSLDAPCYKENCTNPDSDVNYAISIPITPVGGGNGGAKEQTYTGDAANVGASLLWGAGIAITASALIWL